jgi:dTDP-4-dehydrorhamnose 3,5-epimerase-like enzyme
VGVEDCRPVELPVVEDPLGDLAFAEAGRHIPFQIARAFHVYGVPPGARRGGHAHRELEQVVFCLSGKLEVAVTDGVDERAFSLADPRVGLYLPPMVWHDLACVGENTIYTALASTRFDEDDYFRDFDDFLAARRQS